MHTTTLSLILLLAPAMAQEPEAQDEAEETATEQAEAEETATEQAEAEPEALEPEPEPEPEPEAETSEPEAETPEPEAETPEPEAETPEPEAETPEPEAETPEPEAETQPESLDDASAQLELRYREALQLLQRAEEAGASLDEAAATLERIIEKLDAGQAPGFEHADQVWYLLGWSLRDLHPTRAAVAWEEVVKRYPDSSLAGASLIHLGEVAMADEDWELAASWLERARTGPYGSATQHQAGYLVGWVHYHCGAWDEAVEALAGVVKPAEDNDLRDEALEYLALVWLARGEAEGGDVVRLLDGFLPQIPADLRPRFTERCAELLDQSARFEEAQALRSGGAKARRPRRKRTKAEDR